MTTICDLCTKVVSARVLEFDFNENRFTRLQRCSEHGQYRVLLDCHHRHDPTEQAIRTLDDHRTICLSCFERAVGHCDNCGMRVRRPLNDGWCLKCVTTKGFTKILKPAHFSRNVSLAGSDKAPKLGIELEYTGNNVKCSGSELTGIMSRANNKYRYLVDDYGFVLPKRDGSVQIEFNFDALSASLWHKQGDRLGRMFLDLQACGFEEDIEAGIHIHVNRAFFKSDIKQENFILFVNKCRRYWSILSQRDTNWASYQNMVRSGIEISCRDKYIAVNTGHSHTLEVRTFKTTFNVEQFLYYIDLVSNAARASNNFKEGFVDTEGADRLFLVFLKFASVKSPSFVNKTIDNIRVIIPNYLKGEKLCA